MINAPCFEQKNWFFETGFRLGPWNRESEFGKLWIEQSPSNNFEFELDKIGLKFCSSIWNIVDWKPVGWTGQLKLKSLWEIYLHLIKLKIGD